MKHVKLYLTQVKKIFIILLVNYMKHLILKVSVADYGPLATAAALHGYDLSTWLARTLPTCITPKPAAKEQPVVHNKTALTPKDKK